MFADFFPELIEMILHFCDSPTMIMLMLTSRYFACQVHNVAPDLLLTMAMSATALCDIPRTVKHLACIDLRVGADPDPSVQSIDQFEILADQSADFPNLTKIIFAHSNMDDDLIEAIHRIATKSPALRHFDMGRDPANTAFITLENTVNGITGHIRDTNPITILSNFPFKFVEVRDLMLALGHPSGCFIRGNGFSFGWKNGRIAFFAESLQVSKFARPLFQTMLIIARRDQLTQIGITGATPARGDFREIFSFCVTEMRSVRELVIMIRANSAPHRIEFFHELMHRSRELRNITHVTFIDAFPWIDSSRTYSGDAFDRFMTSHLISFVRHFPALRTMKLGLMFPDEVIHGAERILARRAPMAERSSGKQFITKGAQHSLTPPTTA